MPLELILFNQKSYISKDVQHAYMFCNRIKEIYPDETPALIHGDI